MLLTVPACFEEQRLIRPPCLVVLLSEKHQSRHAPDSAAFTISSVMVRRDTRTLACMPVTSLPDAGIEQSAYRAAAIGADHRLNLPGVDVQRREQIACLQYHLPQGVVIIPPNQHTARHNNSPCDN
jgi:hypothetical protein